MISIGESCKSSVWVSHTFWYHAPRIPTPTRVGIRTNYHIYTAARSPIPTMRTYVPIFLGGRIQGDYEGGIQVYWECWIYVTHIVSIAWVLGSWLHYHHLASHVIMQFTSQITQLHANPPQTMVQGPAYWLIGSLAQPTYLDLAPMNPPSANSTHMMCLSLVNRAITQSSWLPSIFWTNWFTMSMNWEHGVCLDWLIKSIVWSNVMSMSYLIYNWFRLMLIGSLSHERFRLPGLDLIHP